MITKKFKQEIKAVLSDIDDIEEVHGLTDATLFEGLKDYYKQITFNKMLELLRTINNG